LSEFDFRYNGSGGYRCFASRTNKFGARMRGMKRESPNPAGREGKPFSLAPYSFEDALQKILKATPEPKAERKKAQPKKTSKKR
jgi:hypothetical protein